jgi:hypothetical protein
MLTGVNPCDHAVNRLTERPLFCFSLLGPKNQWLTSEARTKRARLGVSVNLRLYLVSPMLADKGKLKLVGVTYCAVRAAILLFVELRGQAASGAAEWFIHLG